MKGQGTRGWEAHSELCWGLQRHHMSYEAFCEGCLFSLLDLYSCIKNSLHISVAEAFLHTENLSFQGPLLQLLLCYVVANFANHSNSSRLTGIITISIQNSLITTFNSSFFSSPSSWFSSASSSSSFCVTSNKIFVASWPAMMSSMLKI
jgi:hypothetical protein